MRPTTPLQLHSPAAASSTVSPAAMQLHAAVIALATEKSPGIGRRTRAICPFPTSMNRLESGAGRMSLAV